MAKLLAQLKKGINIVNAKLGYSSEVITLATGLAMELDLTSTCMPCDDYALGKVKGCRVLQILGERLFFNVSSPLTHIFGCKEHWLLLMEDSTDLA